MLIAVNAVKIKKAVIGGIYSGMVAATHINIKLHIINKTLAPMSR